MIKIKLNQHIANKHKARFTPTKPLTIVELYHKHFFSTCITLFVYFIIGTSYAVSTIKRIYYNKLIKCTNIDHNVFMVLK